MLKKIDDNTIDEAVRRLQEAAPGAIVILFGSHARGDSRPDSDADFLVIEPELKSRRAEMVRLRDVLRPLRIPVDIVVTNEATYEEWADTPGTLFYEVKQEGKIFNAMEISVVPAIPG